MLNLATIIELLRHLKRKNHRFNFNITCKIVFNELKTTIARKLHLAIFNFNAATTVTVDSSDYCLEQGNHISYDYLGLEAVLSQTQHNVEVPIAFKNT